MNKRSVLVSSLMIVLAVAAAIAGATFAPFSDTATGSGSIGAGVVDITINGSDQAVLAFSTDECTNMAPGHNCVQGFTIGAGDSTLSATWAGSTVITGGNGCFIVESTTVPAGTAEEGDATDDHDPGATGAGSVTISVVDNNDCQGAAADVVVTLTATQSATPYN